MNLFRRNRITVPKELSFDEAIAAISESAGAAADCGYDPEKLHCHGCINSCALARARCDFGRRVKRALHAGE